MSQSGPVPPAWRSADGRTLAALAAVTALALTLRLYQLGDRVFHWDESRVGYWTLRYAETGQFEYAPIIHGPFLRIVNATLFGLVPPTDFTARLVVALVGGLLPLAAWLFRDHLDRAELVALAALLATNPLLVYYSRFMRNDVLVGAFAVVALGFAVRTLDTRDVRYLYPGVFFLALSATTKANTLLYVLCFLGAAVLIADHRLVRSVHGGRSLRAVLLDWRDRTLAETRRMTGDRSAVGFLAIHLTGTTATFLAVIVFFYAPRPLLYTALGTPGLWPTVVSEATVGAARELVDLWIAGDMQEGNPYLEFLRHELETLAHTAAVVLALALVGVVVEWYGRGRPADLAGSSSGLTGDGGSSSGPTSDGGSSSELAGERESSSGLGGDRGSIPTGRSRALVAFAVYWGLASLVGYPIATDINAPWSAVHIVFPLTIPAAVGLAYLAREFRTAVDAEDRRAAAVGGLILLVVVAGVAAPTVAYWNSADPDRTEMVQWSQPHNDLREPLDDMEAVIEHHDGDVDVLFVGSESAGGGQLFYVEDESVADEKGAVGGWYDRLPLPWYYERAGATVDSVPADADYESALADAPPVVIAHGSDREALEPHLDGYRASSHELRLWGFEVTVFIEEDALREAGRE